jgi:hypothetical protein
MGRCSRSGSDSGRRNARRDARPPPRPPTRRGTPLLNRPQLPATLRQRALYQGRQLPSPTGQGDAIDSRRIVFGRRAGWHHWHHRRSDLACICPSLVPTSSALWYRSRRVAMPRSSVAVQDRPASRLRDKATPSGGLWTTPGRQRVRPGWRHEAHSVSPRRAAVYTTRPRRRLV